MLPTDVMPISVDDHVIEPANLWTDRLPAKWREASPRIVEFEDGRQAWQFQDELAPYMAEQVRLREGLEHVPRGLARYDEMRPGCFDAKARLQDMNCDGVWGQLLFPTYPRFAGHRFMSASDPELGAACLSVYNDWLVEEWHLVAPDRLFPLAVLPLWNIDRAVAEVRRVAGTGVRAVGFSENPSVLGLPPVGSTHWDPLWAAIQDADLAVCMHIGSSSKMITSSDAAPVGTILALVGVNSMIAPADWLFGGIFDRFPHLRVLLSEGGAGWVPYILERADHAFRLRGPESGASRPPSEIFADHIYVCMIVDNYALANLGRLPVANVMWESDYPHSDSQWPNSRNVLEAAMLEVRSEHARMVAENNARRVLRLPDGAAPTTSEHSSTAA